MNLREGSERNSFLPEDGPWTGVPENGQFTIYLQPKVDMRTKEVVGAEALLRILDEKGNLLPHGRVIESMEKDGIISRLDYAVFDKVLETLSRWKQKKYPPALHFQQFFAQDIAQPHGPGLRIGDSKPLPRSADGVGGTGNYGNCRQL